MGYIVNYSTDEIPTIEKWFKEGGGIMVWGTLDLSRPGTTRTTAINAQRPHWSCPNEPEIVVTDSSKVGVVSYKEVKRFHVAIRPSGNGLSFKLTNNSSERLCKALVKAGDGAIYRFDYETQEAVILVPDKVVSLEEWMKDNG